MVQKDDAMKQMATPLHKSAGGDLTSGLPSVARAITRRWPRQLASR